MSQKQLEALLGRSLTPKEKANCTPYLEIATQQLEELLCISLSQESGERIFESRVGYSTLFPGIFTRIESVSINGETVDPSEYHLSFFNDRNKGFYNSIVFKKKLVGQEVTVNADWGFDKIPSDLGQLLAQLFVLASKPKKNTSVKSKRVEDFQITFGDNTDMEEFLDNNSVVLYKYGMCDITDTRSGSLYGVRGDGHI
jgi:hypothetical protein